MAKECLQAELADQRQNIAAERTGLHKDAYHLSEICPEFPLFLSSRFRRQPYL